MINEEYGSMRKMIQSTKQKGHNKLTIKERKEGDFFRMYPEGVCAFGSLSRVTKEYITKDLMIDIDMVNSHPTIALEVARILNFSIELVTL